MDARYARLLIGIASAIVVLLIAVVVIVATNGNDDTTSAPVTTAPTASTATTAAPPASSSPTTASTSTTSTTAAPIPSSTTTSTPTTTTTTTTMPTGACSGLPSIGVGGGASDQTVAFGDVDGNGFDDDIVVYREAGSWWLNVELDYGWATEIPLTGFVARAIDVVNLGVGEEVIIAQIDSGASAEIMGFFAFQSCSIIHAIDGNTGVETAFPVGGSVTHLDGVTCAANGITVTSAANDLNDPNLWQYTETSYVWVPGLGEFQPTASSIQMLVSPGDDATIFGAAAFGC